MVGTWLLHGYHAPHSSINLSPALKSPSGPGFVPMGYKPPIVSLGGHWSPSRVIVTARASFPGGPKMSSSRGLQGVTLQERSDSYLPASGMPLHASPQPRSHHHTGMWGTDSSSQRRHSTLQAPACGRNPHCSRVPSHPVLPTALAGLRAWQAVLQAGCKQHMPADRRKGPAHR